jgi:hypothetical protein
MTDVIPIETIVSKIIWLRGDKVLLDRDLAVLYGVDTKVLKQAVRRSIKRFPPDFMFELTREEFENWRSQFVTSNGDKMGLRYAPMAFTEHGVAMLSSVLKSERAIEVNIAIIRAFVSLRQMLVSHERLARKLEEMEMNYDERFRIVFEAIQQLAAPPDPPRKRIGFEVGEPKPKYGKK